MWMMALSVRDDSLLCWNIFDVCLLSDGVAISLEFYRRKSVIFATDCCVKGESE